MVRNIQALNSFGTAYHENGRIAYNPTTRTFFDSYGKIVVQESYMISLGKGIDLQIIPDLKITVYGRKVK